MMVVVVVLVVVVLVVVVLIVVVNFLLYFLTLEILHRQFRCSSHQLYGGLFVNPLFN